MSKEILNKISASEIVNYVNRIPGMHLEHLYQAGSEHLTQAAFVDMLSHDPQVAERWFDLLDNKARLDAQNSMSELINQIAIQDYKISSFSYHLPINERKKLDALVESMSQVRKHSRNSLIGAMIRHHKITSDMIRADGTIFITNKDERVGLLAFAHGFKLSERSVKNLKTRELASAVISPPEIPIVTAATIDLASLPIATPEIISRDSIFSGKSKIQSIFNRIFRTPKSPSREAVYP